MNYGFCVALIFAVISAHSITESSALLDWIFGSASPEKLQSELDEVTDSLANGTLTDFNTIESYLDRVLVLSDQLGQVNPDEKFYRWIGACRVEVSACDWFRHGFINFTADSYIANGRDIGTHLQPYLDNCATKAYNTCAISLEAELKNSLDQLSESQKADLETIGSVFIKVENPSDAIELTKKEKQLIGRQEDVINALPEIFKSQSLVPESKENQIVTFEGATKEQTQQISHVYGLCSDIINKAWDVSMNYFALMKYSYISDFGNELANTWVPRIGLCWQIRVAFGGKTVNEVYEQVRRLVQEDRESDD